MLFQGKFLLIFQSKVKIKFKRKKQSFRHFITYFFCRNFEGEDVYSDVRNTDLQRFYFTKEASLRIEIHPGIWHMQEKDFKRF